MDTAIRTEIMLALLLVLGLVILFSTFLGTDIRPYDIEDEAQTVTSMERN